jgi:hypothetical protein
MYMKLEINRGLFVGVDGVSLRIWMWGMDWIDLAQERDRWRTVVNAVMNIQVP